MRYAKAYVSAAIAGLAYAQASAAGGIDLGEGIGIALATVTAFGATAWVRNAPDDSEGDDLDLEADPAGNLP